MFNLEAEMEIRFKEIENMLGSDLEVRLGEQGLYLFIFKKDVKLCLIC